MHQFAFPPTMYKSSFFPTSSSTLVASCVFDFSLSNWCEVISYCGLDLCIPDDEWCRASFHVSVGHLYVFFGEMSFHLFCPFLDWIICFFGCWVWEVLYRFWILVLFLIRHLQISSPILSLVFWFCDCFLCCAKAFYLGEVPIVHFCFCFPCLWRCV